MAPPLVRQLVRRNEIQQIDIVGLLHALDETDVFGIGHGVGKRLGELAVSRKFKDAKLVELVFSKIPLAIVQASFGGIHHLIQVEFVAGLVINFELHVFPLILLYAEAAGKKREEIVDAGVAHAVVKIAAPVFGPLTRQVARRDRDLIWR